jgi:hypothetical protein
MAKFNFFARFPASNKTAADKISIVIEKELKFFGKVIKPEMIVKTEKGDAIDLSGFDGGVTLTYEITNVTSPEGKNLGIVRASLNLSTSVLVQKTTDECESYIWSNNCFLKGSVEKNLETLVSQSLSYLLNKFENNYTAVNPTKPIFNLYTQ